MRSAGGLVYWARRILSKLWVRVSLFSVLAIAVAVAARVLGPYLPENLERQISVDALATILEILATSMLTVSTFSLGIMAAAIGSASLQVTPRATTLLLDERVSQTVLAVFLGAFLFSLISLVLLRLDVYASGGRILLMAATVLVIFLIYAAFLRWIEMLRAFGRVPDTLDRIENATVEALSDRLRHPHRQCCPQQMAPAEGVGRVPLKSARIGYVRNVDLPALQAAAERHHCRVHVAREPGRFVDTTRPLAFVEGVRADDSAALAALRAAFVIDRERDFVQDPRLGLIALAETAGRALSPAVNDPGTAISVLRRTQRILSCWTDDEVPDRVRYPSISWRPMDPEVLLRDVFPAIARDGSRQIEVMLCLHKTLLGLAQHAPGRFAAPAQVLSREAMVEAEAGRLGRAAWASLVAVSHRIEDCASAAGVAQANAGANGSPLT